MMKLILVILVSIILTPNVSAEEERRCSNKQITESQELLKNTSYTLEYDPYYENIVGEFEEGYMKIQALGLPSGYKMVIYIDDNTYVELNDNSSIESLAGGVYRVEYFRGDCDTQVKSFEMRVPFYKQYCGVSVNCKEDAFFDGTYENTASNQNKKRESKVSTILIVILVILIIVIIGAVVIIVKRRHDSEQQFN